MFWSLILSVNDKDCSFFNSPNSNFLDFLLSHTWSICSILEPWAITGLMIWGAFRILRHPFTRYWFWLLANLGFSLNCDVTFLIVKGDGVLSSCWWNPWFESGLWPCATFLISTFCFRRWIYRGNHFFFCWPHFHYLLAVHALDFLRIIFEVFVIDMMRIRLFATGVDFLNGWKVPPKLYCKVWGRHFSLLFAESAHRGWFWYHNLLRRWIISTIFINHHFRYYVVSKRSLTIYITFLTNHLNL